MKSSYFRNAAPASKPNYRKRALNCMARITLIAALAATELWIFLPPTASSRTEWLIFPNATLEAARRAATVIGDLVAHGWDLLRSDMVDANHCGAWLLSILMATFYAVHNAPQIRRHFRLWLRKMKSGPVRQRIFVTVQYGASCALLFVPIIFHTLNTSA